MVEDYDEFGMFHENAADAGLAFDRPPVVERVSVAIGGSRRLSGLQWGTGDPQVVLLHGGAQNAHTWDTVLMALDRPALAIDLPGHGHSDWRDDHAYSPQNNAVDAAAAVEQLAPDADLLVGMSLGGLTAFCKAAQRPDLVDRLAIIDVTPGTDHAKAEPIVTFISGPEVFGSFEEILERTVEFNPTRSVSSLRRGILHNARPNPDGTWTWRWDPVKDWDLADGAEAMPDFGSLWDQVDAVQAPIHLLRGGAKGSVVDDADVEELLRRQPTAEVVTVEGAGHSIQGDRPLVLAEHLDRLLGL
jgi:pimeloyl-ACP methyl ester carboxylesterase